MVVPLQLVDELLDLAHGLAWDDPQRRRFATPAELLPRVPVRECRVRRVDRPGVLERLALAFLAEDFPDQATSASIAPRTHSVSSRVRRRSSNRSSVFGPCPVTTCLSSAQSGSLYSQTSPPRF